MSMFVIHQKCKIGVQRLDLVSIARNKGSQPRVRLPTREASADVKKEKDGKQIHGETKENKK